jgi:glycosyltransferase involved in cell wall biosynthesis
MAPPLLSIIIPCKNEEKTIGAVIGKAVSTLKQEGLDGEIIVSDNSTDNSREIARKMGAKIVIPQKNGYGSACLEGFRHARGTYLILADADDTYDLSEMPKFLKPLLANEADFVIGSRFKGEIKKNSMPWLHRYIGNPLLTGTLNWLFKMNISDAHCGMRAITRDAYEKLGMKSEGMEFASEMIIEAGRKKLRINEAPITYYPRQTPSKLHSWGDGWRHLRFMMLYNPVPFFYIPGLLLFMLGAFMTTAMAIRGNVETTSLHSFILGSMLTIIGTQMIASGSYINVYGITHNKTEKSGITAKILDYHSIEYGLALGIVLFFAGIVLGSNIFFKWIYSGYGSLSEEENAVISVVLAIVGIQIIFSALMISVFMLEKKGWHRLRFMRLYNPTPFFHVPGLLLLILGVFMTIALAIRGNVETTSLHSFILGGMLTIIGTQMIASGSYIKVYGIMHNKIEKSGITAKILDYHSIEYGLVLGIVLFFAGIALGSNIFFKWISSGYGSLSETENAVISAVLTILGIQIIFSSLVISVFVLEKKDNKMKLAFVYDAVYPWIKGGAEKRIYELGKRLAEDGHEVHIFGVKWWDGADLLEYEGMMLHGVCKPSELYVNGRRSIPEAIIFSIKLLPHLIRKRFDVIDASAFPYFSCFTVKLVSILRRTPTTITWHEVWGDYWYEYMGPHGFFGKLVEYMASKLTHRPIVVSAVTKKNLKVLGVNVENIHIVPNGIDLRRIAKIAPSPDECDIIFVGRLIREKNVDVLLEAVGHVRDALPDVKCCIIGDGPERERLVGLATMRGLLGNVGFIGFMGYEEVISRIKSSKMLVLPSSREGFGMVVIEAFACGVPVITVKGERNAASMLVSETTGLVVNLDAVELGNAICALITDDALREKMAAAARDVAQEYDWDKIACQLSCMYEELI